MVYTQNDLLITVHFNHPYFDNISLLETYLSTYGDVLFYCDNAHINKHDKVIGVQADWNYQEFKEFTGGHWSYRSFIDSYENNKNKYNRFMFMMDDDIPTPECFKYLESYTQPCFGRLGRSYDHVKSNEWCWLEHPTVKPHIQNVINDLGSFWGGGYTGDFYHLYKSDAQTFIDKIKYFDNRDIFLEVAVACVSQYLNNSTELPKDFLLNNLKLSYKRNQNLIKALI
jgi:hypothetical protein